MEKPKKERLTKGQKTQLRLIDAASVAFYEHGYQTTTISTICKKAKVAVGTFYNYFPDKFTLYKQVLLQFQNTIRGHLNEKIKPGMSRKEKERAGLKAWIQFIYKYPQTYKVIWESLFIDRSIFVDYYMSFADAYYRGLNRDLEQLKDNRDLHVVTYALMGISNFIGLKVIFENELTEEKLERTVDSIMQMLENGLLK